MVCCSLALTPISSGTARCRGARKILRRPVLTGLLIAVLAVVGWWGVHREARQALESGIARFASSLPPGARFSYAAAQPLLLMRGAELQSVVYREGQTTLTIADLRVAGFSGYPPLGLHLRRLMARDVRYSDAQRSLALGDVDLSGLTLPPVDRAAHIVPDVGAILLEDGTANRIQASAPGITSLLTGRMVVHDYALGHRSDLTLADLSVQMDTATALPTQQIGRPPAAIHAHVGHFHQTGVDLATQLSRFVSGQHGTPATSAPLVGTQTSSADGVQFDLGPASVLMDHIDSTDDHTADTDQMTVNVHGVSIPAVPADFGGKPGDVTLKATVDRKHATMALSRVDVTVPDACTATLTGQFDHVPVDTIHTDVRQMRLVSFGVTYRDAGFINAAMNHVAIQHHTDAGQLRASLTQQGQVMRIILPPLGTLIDYIAAPDGHTLQLGINPPTPLTTQELQGLHAANPLERIQSLGFTAQIQ